MSSEQRKRHARMAQLDGPTLELVVERGHIEAGRTFSAEAMDTLNDDMATWVGTRITRRWERTQEPPTRLRVTITVDVA
jgi:hypothetical protein